MLPIPGICPLQRLMQEDSTWHWCSEENCWIKGRLLCGLQRKGHRLAMWSNLFQYFNISNETSSSSSSAAATASNKFTTRNSTRRLLLFPKQHFARNTRSQKDAAMRPRALLSRIIALVIWYQRIIRYPRRIAWVHSRSRGGSAAGTEMAHKASAAKVKLNQQKEETSDPPEQLPPTDDPMGCENNSMIHTYKMPVCTPNK